MRKENVFLVTFRQRSADGCAIGDVVNHVVCGIDEVTVRRYLSYSMPKFVVLSVVSLLAIETMAKKIKTAATEKTNFF